MSDLLTIDFRDGERDVPRYFVQLMSMVNMDPFQLTYEEARVVVNKAMTRRFLNDFQEKLVTNHLVRNGSWD